MNELNFFLKDILKYYIKMLKDIICKNSYIKLWIKK